MSKQNPIIRIWGRKRESDWNEYWTMHHVLSRKDEIASALGDFEMEVDVCPRLVPLASPPFRELEVFVSYARPEVTRRICSVIQDVTRFQTDPSPAGDSHEFRERARQFRLHQRHPLQPWDGALPCLILGIDFETGGWHENLRPAEPGRWRLIDHDVDGVLLHRQVMAAIILEPTEAGKDLLAELDQRFSMWCQGTGWNGRPPLDEILEYRRVLQKYGVDCNESFHDGLAEAWYPMDVGGKMDLKHGRHLFSTSLPDHLGDLLRNEENNPVEKYRAYFQFVALTKNS